MASGQDPLADMQNILGYQGLVGPNPFDPFPIGNQTQTGIPFSGGAGPGVGFIAGMPTQAWSGQPIGAPPQQQAAPAQPPGMTINSNPVQASGGLSQAQQSALGQWGPAINELMNNYQATPAGRAMANNPNAPLMNYIQSQNQNMQAYPQGGSSGFGPNSGPLSAAQRDQMTNNALMLQQLQAQGSAQGSAPPSGSAPNGVMLSRQDYLSRLANPGPLPVYGAGPPQAGQTQTGTPPPSVVQAFLSAQGGKNTPFVNTLNKLQGAPS